MGQAVSSGNISSIFGWSSSVSRTASPHSDRCQDCNATSERSDEETEVQSQKNINSFSCFRSHNTTEDVGEENLEFSSNSRFESMRPSKRTCRFCNNDDNRDVNNLCHSSNTQNPNENCMRYYDNVQMIQNDMSEINGNRVDSVQSCSFENSNLQTRNAHSTSINRYVNTFTERLEKISLKDEQCEDPGVRNLHVKSKESKRPCKQKKGILRECNGCLKETKNNNKLGTKKKNTWIKFYGTKLSKNGNNRTPVNGSCTSTSDPDPSCVCTSYRKMDESNKQENDQDIGASAVSDPPVIHHNLSFGWACERVNINRNSGLNWSTYTGGPVVNSSQNRGAECISCEGSHCHMDLNALAADITNMRRVPLNITVTRVETNRSHATPLPTEENVIVVSLGSQKFPVIDLKRFNPEMHIVEDCDVKARFRRALEIAEGIEPPPGYNSPQVVNPGELRALLFQQPSPTTSFLTNQPVPQRARIHTQVDYIHCLVPDLHSIINCSYYWGKMDRYEAERLLDRKPEGTFLLRDSAQEEYLFSVSFRKYERSLHARIEQFNHKFSFDSHDPCVYAADTVTGLIEHYKDPTCVMFFEPMLTVPLSRTFAFPLQHLCRAVIVSRTTYDGINELKLPPIIKAYLKEYHYRQRVRVKRFDESPESSEESQ